MNHAQHYIFGSYKARILPDGSISYYREILTPDGRELIGREYPHEGYCWFNLTRAALKVGLSRDDISQAEQSARELVFNDPYLPARLAELERAV